MDWHREQRLARRDRVKAVDGVGGLDVVEQEIASESEERPPYVAAAVAMLADLMDEVRALAEQDADEDEAAAWQRSAIEWEE